MSRDAVHSLDGPGYEMIRPRRRLPMRRLVLTLLVLAGCGGSKSGGGNVDAGPSCGALGEICCSGATCDTGACAGGICRDCGASGKTCCDGRTCDDSSICTGG